jgi:hypothetical protein
MKEILQIASVVLSIVAISLAVKSMIHAWRAKKITDRIIAYSLKKP